METIAGRPDFSNYLVHFTLNGKPKIDISENPTQKYSDMGALEKLINILTDNKIIASITPWTQRRAVCFTECPWTSLLEHTKTYSPYGIAFEKSFIFSRNGSPVYYVRADQFKKQKWDKDLYPFVTPFWPGYRPAHLKESIDFGTCDFSHEREWRVPHDLPFEYDHISFIVLNTYEDMAGFPQQLKDNIGSEKFILMDNYRYIEKLWPVHIMR